MLDNINQNEIQFLHVLKTRIGYEWPYSTHFSQNNVELELWLENNCCNKYRIFVGRHEKIVYFKSAEDLILYKLTWE